MLVITRRHFLSKLSTGIGGAALAAMFPRPRLRRVHPTPAYGFSPISRPRRSASSICSCPAARRSWTSSTTSRCSTNERPAAARLRARRPAPHRHVGQPGVASARPARSSSSRSTASPAPGSANCCRTPRRSPTTSASSIDVHRGDQPRPGDHVFPDRLPDRRPARARRVAQLRPRHRRTKNLPAFVVLVTPKPRPTSRSTRASGAAGFLDSQLPGRAVPRGKDPVLYLSNPDGVCRRPPRDARSARRAQPASSSRRNSTPRSKRASPSTRWRSACRPACPRSPISRSEPDSDLRALRPGREASPAPSPPTACWPAGWPSAACASSSSTIRAGTSTATCPTAIQQPVQGHRPGRRRAGRPT